jgi:hypothetical protein
VPFVPLESVPNLQDPAAVLSASRLADDAAVVGRGLSRAAFLRGALAAALAAAGSRFLAPSAALAESAIGAAAVDPALSPLDLRFTTIEQFRPFDLLPLRFVQVHERFDGAGVAPRYAGTGLQAGGRPAEVDQVGRALRLRSSADAPTLFRTGSAPVAPYATVIVTSGTAAQGGGGRAAILAGLVRDARNYVVATFDAGNDPAKGTVGIDLAVDGRRTRVASASADLTASARFAFVVNENYVTALVAGDTSWTPIAQSRITGLLDLRDPAVLRQYQYGFGIGGAGAAADIASLEAGYFGEVGIRDPHVVSYADGTPCVRDNKLYFTATQAGLAFFPAAHWGVWTLDLDDPSRVEPVAALFFARDGLVLGDHAGQIVIDERDGGFHVAVSGWGDFSFNGVHVHYVRTSEDVLSGVHVLESAPLPLPTGLSSWDPAMARIDGRWYVAFVESPYQDRVRGFDFHPALARSEAGGAVTELGRVGADLTRHQTEGVILQKIGGRWYLLASDGKARQYPVYDLSMRELGVLNAPYGTNIPHPQIVPVPHGGRTRYLLITFNGTPFHEPMLGYGTHGDLILMRASQSVPGYEFTPRRN